MHSSTLLVAGVALLSTLVSAAEEPRRPKFYFPRQVKRQIFTNSSSSESTLTETTLTTSTRRLSLTDLFDIITSRASDIDSPTQNPGGVDTVVATTTLTTVELFPLPTTPPFSQSTGAGLPSSIVEPTTTPSEDSTSPSVSSTSPSSSTGGIIIPGPGGSLTSSVESSTTPPSPTSEEVTSTSAGVTFTGSSASTAPVTSEQPTATSGPAESSTVEASSSVVAPSSTAPETTPTPLPETSAATTEIGTSTSAQDTETPSSLPTSAATVPASSDPVTTEPATTSPAASELSSSGILGPVTSVLESITSALGSLSSDIVPTSTPIPEGTGSIPVVTPSVTATPEPESTGASSTGLGDIISSILSTGTATLPETSDVTTPPVVSPTDASTIIEPPVGNGTETQTPPTTSTEVTLPPSTPTDGQTTPTDTTIVTPTETTVPPTETPLPPPAGNATETLTSLTPEITPSPIPGNNETTIIVDPTTTLPPSQNGTSISVPEETATTPIILPTANVTEPATPTITTLPIQPTNGTEIALPPTSTGTPPAAVPGTTMDFGTSLIVAPTTTEQTPGATVTVDPTGVPSTLPKVIINPDEVVENRAPPGTAEVQIGFQYPLNYKFVVTNAMSSAQIFEYLPNGMADGLNVTRDQVTIKSLSPLDTTSQLGFITTVARAYIPETSLLLLQASIILPSTALYNNADERIETLMNYINPGIPIQPGVTLGGGGNAAPGDATNGDGEEKEEGPFNGEQATSSGKVNGTTAGFVVAGVGGAVAYGAAMFLIARRYKKRRQSHRRSQSLTNPAEMMQSGSPSFMGGAGAFMSGGRVSPGGTNDRNSRGSGRTGNSARTAQISAPMMAENSLGWN